MQFAKTEAEAAANCAKVKKQDTLYNLLLDYMGNILRFEKVPHMICEQSTNTKAKESLIRWLVDEGFNSDDNFTYRKSVDIGRQEYEIYVHIGCHALNNLKEKKCTKAKKGFCVCSGKYTRYKK